MIYTFKKIAVFTLVFLIAFTSFGNKDLFATTTGVYTLVNAATNQSFVNGSITAGEAWVINITNATPNSPVAINSIQVTPNNTAGPGTGVIHLGFTDANGNARFTNTTSQVDIGNWTETLTVGGLMIDSYGPYNFVVNPATPPEIANYNSPSNNAINYNSCVQLVNTKNNLSIIDSTMFAGESWKMTIRGATPNAPVFVKSTQIEPGGGMGLGTGTINLGFTDANGNAQFTNTTTGVDVGRWVETVTVGDVQLCDQFVFHVLYAIAPQLPQVITPIQPATTTPPVVPAINHVPTISLVGNNPFNIVVGANFIDPGATATDVEDGNITNKIVVTGTVNTAVAGTYTRTYTVTDLGGLTASTTRQVVVSQGVPSVNTSGKITVCLVLADSNNKIATSSTVFPSGMFGIQLGTTQAVASTSVFSKVWNTQTFTPNRTLLTGTPDADCVEVSNLDATASYYYSPLSVIGSAWKTALYNDNLIGSVASTSDFFPYNTDIANNTYPVSNSNSVINLTLTNNQRTFVIYNTYTATGTPATTTPPVNPPVEPTPVRACTIVSDTSTYTGGVQSVATYNQNPLWTANIPGATWIWSTFKVANPLATSTTVFTKTFIATSTPSQATLSIAADNSYIVRINGVLVGQSADEFNFTSTTQDVYSVGSAIAPGVNTITFEVTNHALPNGTSETNPAGLLYKLELIGGGCGPVVVVNQAPMITLIGSNPAQVTVGDSFIDPGATATDVEDGNITNKIVVTGTVNTAVAGTYTRTYTVTDLGGLTASTTRQIVVSNPSNGGATAGNIKFCLVLADSNNQIATSSSNLPFGSFVLNLGSTTNIAAGSIFSKTWNTMSFTPSERIILTNGKDAECEQLQNVPFGTYYYSTLGVSGSQWNTAKYNDQNTQPVNNVFDFFPYSPELFNATTTDDASRNTNSDGQIVLDASMREKTLVMYSTYNPAPQCLIPSLTSPLTAQVTVNNAFSYTLTGTTTVATTSPLVFSVATSTLPSGLFYATSTNTISGTPTQVGTYNITLRAENTCGVDIKTLVLSVVALSTGGGGNTPAPDLVVTKTSNKSTASVGDTVTYTVTVANNGTLTATGVSVTDILPTALDFVSATSTLGSYATSTGVWTIGNLPISSSTALTIVTTIKSGTEGQKITNTASASSNETDLNNGNNTTSADVNVNVPPSTGCSSNCGGGGGGGGGNGPIVTNRLTIFNEQVVETAPGVAFVSWNTTLPATRRVTYGNESQSNLGLAPNYGYSKSTDLISSPLQTQHGMVVSIVSGQTYYFRPISTDATDTAIGKQLTITGGANGGGGSSTGGTGGTAENSCYYLFDYLRKDFNNNPVEVKKLQIFLKDLEGFSTLPVTGVYDDATIAAVNAFQIRYQGDVLTPWGYEGNEGTNYVYILTKKKVNEIYCKFAFPVNAQQQAEIDATRALFESLRNAGIEIGGTPAQPTTPVDLENNVIGSATTTGSGTLANASTTQNFAQRMTANVLSASKKFGAMAIAFFTWPFQSSVWQSIQDGFKTLGNNILSWLLLALVLAIIVVAYLWYLEYKNNKKIEEMEKIEEMNKEIDLK